MAKDAMPQTVLVAGAAGFIGSHLCDAFLAREMKVIGLDSYCTGRPRNLAHLAHEARFTFIQRDVIDPLPPSIRADLILNLACAASPPQYQIDPVHTMLTNVLGTRNLLALAADCGSRLLLASTSEVYGDPLTHPQTEEYWGNVNPTGPRACYDEGKRAAEALCFDYVRAGRVDVRVARIFNTYGPRMRHDDGRVVSNMITQALRDEDLTMYGDGTQTRSFCYIQDLVDGIVRLSLHRRPVPRPINFGNPAELTVAELAVKVLELTGARSSIVRRPLPVDDPKRRRPDISAARELLGWSPKVALEKGLSRTIEWLANDPAVLGCSTERLDAKPNGRATVSASPA
jgi:UDP-glucuronate decarboxylase